MKKFLVLSFIVCMFCLVGCQNNTEPDKVLSQNTGNIVEENNDSQSLVSDNNVDAVEPVNTTSDTTSIIEEKVDVVTKTEDPVKSLESIKEVEKNIVVPQVKDDGITVLKFKNTNSNEYIKTLDGKQVSITGYLSTLSPLNGQFAYLMNMPYQNCPFCVPGTSEITNTLAIFAGNKSKIQFTDQPVTVIGTLEVGDFTDDFGYQYGVRLNNVTVNKADVDALSETAKKYNVLAENGVIWDIYNSIMAADMSAFYTYYDLAEPGKVIMDGVIGTKNNLGLYNAKGDYNTLVSVMDELVTLCENINTDVDNKDYSKFTSYQTQLQNIYYNFAMWMNEGEL